MRSAGPYRTNLFRAGSLRLAALSRLLLLSNGHPFLNLSFQNQPFLDPLSICVEFVPNGRTLVGLCPLAACVAVIFAASLFGYASL
ncbi:hypothetical protein UFOVP440_8 [uncultured Caudovirales phage]|uniref:Uncharacterized protein n=1 Tax=uncultured Caudovirales phage TaxID=2100421 RepID=A0A6J5M950_9CAUD|nr:hypothetical protein UFOVP440_8 [uncultured Caudovirales phage]